MWVTELMKRKRKEKTTPFGVILMRSQVLYRAAQACVDASDMRHNLSNVSLIISHNMCRQLKISS